MKLLVVNPNISENVSELIAAEARRAASRDVEIDVLTAPFGVAYIETRCEAVVGAYAVLTMLAEHYQGYDAVVIAAFGDPGLMAAKEMLPMPVVGLTEGALSSAASLGARFSIVAISRRIRAWYRETVEMHGLHGRLASIRCLEDAPGDIGGIQADKAEQLVALCNAAVQQDDADAIVIAGAPLAGLARSIAGRIPVPVVDGVASAVRHAETLAALATRPATLGSYAPPPQKDWKGLPLPLAKLIGRN